MWRGRGIIGNISESRCLPMRPALIAVLGLWFCVLSASLPSGAAAASAKPLQIYFIDVEGGQATLVVSPSGAIAADRHRLAGI